MRRLDSVLILGGAGLVGYQVARAIARTATPRRIVIASLYRQEALEACGDLEKEFPALEEVVPEWGNLFVRESMKELPRQRILESPSNLDQIYHDIFDSLEAEDDGEEGADGEAANIRRASALVRMVERHEPDAVVDSVNTATGISYQDVAWAAEVVKRFRDELEERLFGGVTLELLERAEDLDEDAVRELCDQVRALRELAHGKLGDRPIDPSRSRSNNVKAIDTLLVSMAIPQLVRHVVLLFQVLGEVGCHTYVKIGTTGTGGMGIDIPYTHGEEKPSMKLLSKSSVGFAHTGLLFLLSRTPGPTDYKEVKPAAMIGYKKVECRPIARRGNRVVLRRPRRETLGESLSLRDAPDDFEEVGPLNMAGVDTGENGFFARGEFEAITHLHQMEYVTPEEIADVVVRELAGRNTGKDVLSALDGAVLDPSYRAGYLRQSAIEKLERLEDVAGGPSVAIGELGPPELSKLLYEAWLLREEAGPDIASILFGPGAEDDDAVEDRIQTLSADALDDRAAALATRLEELVVEEDPRAIREQITSLGLPVLLPDGETLLRGPTISIPEVTLGSTVELEDPDAVDRWANRGWVDLRPANVRRWLERLQRMLQSAHRFVRSGSAAYGISSYPHTELVIGEAVGWIFNNDETVGGHRITAL